MAEAFKIEEIEEKVILVGVSEQEGDDAEDSVAELAELVKTAGATVVGTMIQKRELIHPGTYIGSGKVAELKELVEELGATGIVCDDELSPAQLRNLEDILDFHVKFERIHPFQDGNGRVGRLILFKECLKYNIVPFIIEDDIKMFYYRGLKEWNNEKGYLMDTCLTVQDRYKAYLDYFRIRY